MEIEITEIINNENIEYVTGSIAQLGNDAASITWNRAKNLASEIKFTTEQLAAIRDYAGYFGAWTKEEIAAWSDTEVTALMLQFINTEIQEHGPNFTEGNIFRTEENKYYYYVGF